jgi:GTP pyrophosphokinase
MIIDRIIKKFVEYHPKEDISILHHAFEIAEKAHEGQVRKNGEPYIQHSLNTAFVLTQIKADLATVAAGLLHDVPEDTNYSLEEIKNNFGEEIYSLVKGVTKLGTVKYRGIERYRENLKKMFLAMANDIRVIFIKFSDRLHNLKTLDALPAKKQQRIAQETLEIYAPIAGLLGIWALKWQMEDMCFKYLMPKEYKELEYEYEIEKRAERNQFFQKVKLELEKKLLDTNIEYRIEERFKHLYSIYQKMQKKERSFNEIYDVFALRIITDSIDNCYKILGIIHTIWPPKNNRFKDYIAVPKPNGYRSLHTTIIGPEGKATEFQIRTEEMDEESNYGIAAHWYYKSKGKSNYPKEQPEWVKEILDIQKEIKSTDIFVKNIKLDIFRDRIFVFTPKGDVVELPEKSTPIDFAYAVHTEVGDKAVGVLINDKMASLSQELKNGDMVEIMLDKNRKGPNRSWLASVKTKRAREKISQNIRTSRLDQIRKLISRGK